MRFWAHWDRSQSVLHPRMVFAARLNEEARYGGASTRHRRISLQCRVVTWMEYDRDGDDFCRDTPLMKRYVATLHDSRVNIR